MADVAQVSSFLNNFAKAPVALSPASLKGTREEALRFFGSKGLPSTKEEDWKYTSLQSLDRSAFVPAKKADKAPSASELESFFIPEMESFRITFVDGQFEAGLSKLSTSTTGLELCPLAQALESPESFALIQKQFLEQSKHQEHALHALNTAFFRDGAFLRVSAKATIHHPIQILFYTTTSQQATVVPTRNFILVGEAAEVKIVETHASPEGISYCTSSITEVYCEKNSLVDITKVQLESKKAYHLSSLNIVQEGGSHFSSHAFCFGGLISRNEISPVLNGEHIECILNGLTVIHEDQHVDNSTIIDHAKPNSFSREMYKGIYADKSRGVFSGTIIVRQDAQKTNAIQSNQTLLLSDEASIDTRPQLKIYADDVKCTHGATIGQLDENGLFYLRSRGIDKDEARNLLIHAFASDIIQHVPLEALRAQLETWLMKRLDETVASA